MVNIKFSINKESFYLCAFLTFYYLFLFFIFYYFINSGDYYDNFSEASLRLHADALFYVQLANESDGIGLENLLSFEANYLGPYIILLILGKSSFAVLIFNIFLLNYSLKALKENIPNIDISTFKIWMYINPILFFSLLTINKEILSVTSFLLLFAFHYSNKTKYLFIALTLSFMARWQFLVISIFYIITVYFKFINKSFVITALIIVFTLFLGYAPGFTDHLLEAGLMGEEIQLKFGLSTFINTLQKHYLYFLALPLRFLIQMVFPASGILLNIMNPNTNWTNDFYNVVVIPYSCLVTGIFFFLYFIKYKKFTITHDIPYFVLIILIFIGFTPFASYRYFYPIYVLLALDHCIPNGKKVIEAMHPQS